MIALNRVVKPYLLLGLLLLAGCASGPKISTIELPPLSKDMGRIFFYGQNTRFAGLRGGVWEPKILINGQAINEKHGVRVAFFVDKLPGTYLVEVDNNQSRSHLYPSNSVRVSLKAGKIAYLRMKPEQLGEDWRFRLKILPVEPAIGAKEIPHYKYLALR